MAHEQPIRDFSNKLNYQITNNKLKRSDLEQIQTWLVQLSNSEKASQSPKNLASNFREQLQNAGIFNGRIAEIGGPFNSFSDQMPEYEFEFLSLYPVESMDNVIVTDICQAENIEDARYDAIFSKDVFEHVTKPWNAAKHLSRILKPGGIMYHIAPFSYFYHGAPNDYWRFTPDAFESIFYELTTIKTEFVNDSRRKDNRGSEACPVDRDGGSEFSVDAFGGWRETWWTMYVGKKDAAAFKKKVSLSKAQLLIDLIRTRKHQGSGSIGSLFEVWKISHRIYLSDNNEISMVSPGLGNLNPIRSAWLIIVKELTGQGIRASYNQFAATKQVGL